MMEVVINAFGDFNTYMVQLKDYFCIRIREVITTLEADDHKQKVKQERLKISFEKFIKINLDK
ncbi:hypothetical protein ACKLNQ_18375 [Myroides odoratimimus]|uniref:hypothetical protein n=1 Tax=Myroides odoratimimus TaxID=76832 RepID=UPI0038D4BC4E